ncbi:MAG: chromosomal replication initiator DnaA [Hyphomicrobium sp.]|nr:chromosomal replication initiator DnaA [Hyphomicrobium sp.]
MQRFDGDTIRKIPGVFLTDSSPSPIRSPRKARLVLRRVSRRAPPTAKAPAHIRVVIEASVGQVFGVLAEDFETVTRGRARIAFARQIAMYLAHVACGQSLTDVGRIFARDRTTVAHACARIEDLRDDRRFDRVLDLLEAIVRYRLTPQGAAPGAASGASCSRVA